MSPRGARNSRTAGIFLGFLHPPQYTLSRNKYRSGGSRLSKIRPLQAPAPDTEWDSRYRLPKVGAATGAFAGGNFPACSLESSSGNRVPAADREQRRKACRNTSSNAISPEWGI